MTTTSWSTIAEVPPGPWAALVADVSRLLQLLANSGARVFGPATSAPPLLSDERIHFTVIAPPGRPLTVILDRAAGTGEVITNAPHTDALVLVAVQRARTQWGVLITWTSDAGVAARSAATDLIERLYGPDDRAVSGDAPPAPGQRLLEIANRVLTQVTYGGLAPQDADTATQLDVLLQQLSAERAGLAIAAQVAGTTLPPPVTVPPTEVPALTGNPSDAAAPPPAPAPVAS